MGTWDNMLILQSILAVKFALYGHFKAKTGGGISRSMNVQPQRYEGI